MVREISATDRGDIFRAETDGGADVTMIAKSPVRGIQADPTCARQKGLGPGMKRTFRTAGTGGSVFPQVPTYKTRSDADAAKGLREEDSEIATGTATRCECFRGRPCCAFVAPFIFQMIEERPIQLGQRRDGGLTLELPKRQLHRRVPLLEKGCKDCALVRSVFERKVGGVRGEEKMKRIFFRETHFQAEPREEASMHTGIDTSRDEVIEKIAPVLNVSAIIRFENLCFDRDVRVGLG